ncbi:GNAT family N-acetyltransferase [Alcaligenes sp. Marseille-Q7550]
MPAPQLVTPRLVLRHWRDSDLIACAKMNADARVMEFFPSPLIRQASDALALRIRTGLQENPFGLWAVEIPGSADFAGFIGLGIPWFEAPFMPAIEIGWRLASDFWGKGYATEGAREVLRYGFEELRLKEIVSFTATNNVRSQRVMTRIGLAHKKSDDFDHPALPEGHPLRRHVLYRLKREHWAESSVRR